MKGYLVNLRIVKQSHDHRGLTVWIEHSDDPYPHLNASNEKEAEDAARFLLDRAAEPTHDWSIDSYSKLGVVSVNSVVLVEGVRRVGVAVMRGRER